jgi:hypothetical protein
MQARVNDQTPPECVNENPSRSLPTFAPIEAACTRPQPPVGFGGIGSVPGKLT